MPFAEAQYPIVSPSWEQGEDGLHSMYISLPNGEAILLEYDWDDSRVRHILSIATANSYSDGKKYPAFWVCEITDRGVLAFANADCACDAITAPKEERNA